MGVEEYILKAGRREEASFRSLTLSSLDVVVNRQTRRLDVLQRKES